MTQETVHENYWLNRVRRDAAELALHETTKQSARQLSFDRDDIWFLTGLALILTAAMVWAWSPVVAYGAGAILYSLFWTGMWATLCWLAILRTR